MTRVSWDNVGERRYETGVDRGVLYLPDGGGNYSIGYAWNGLTTVTESPSGAESNKQYADNQVYANLLSAEIFGGTVEAFTYPNQFAQCDGTALQDGVAIGQQARKAFGLSYRTLIGNDVDGTAHGYKLHLMYGALASPSEKAYTTVNDSPEAINFSWEVTTTPVNVTGFRPTSLLVIPSTDVDATALAALEDFLYGTVGTDPSLPLPDSVLGLFAGTITVATPTEPTFNSGTHTITIPTVTGVTYKIGGVTQTAGDHVIAADTVVQAFPNVGYKFPTVIVDRWFYDFV
jgi:hypothetical protein